ncbi:hypothetical protein [Clostridium sp.]|uniref:hypothetical protein n=1 Tax=Clostridium sp. TaxID=1506 RepID=UPI003F3C1969
MDKSKEWQLGLIGAILIPVGIILFNVAVVSDGFLGKITFAFTLSDPYDYAVPVGFQQNGFGEEEIKELANEYNVGLKDFTSFNSLLLGMYSEDVDYRGSANFVSEDDYNNLTGESLDVEKRTIVDFNSFNSSHESDSYEISFLNGTTQDVFELTKVKSISKPGVLSSDERYKKNFYIIDNEDYSKLDNILDERFKNQCYMFNVSNWKETKEFSNRLFDEIVIWSNKYIYRKINKYFISSTRKFTKVFLYYLIICEKSYLGSFLLY